MFQVSIIDHVRFSHESLEAACEAHAEAAARLGRLAFYFRVLLLLATAATATVGALAMTRGYRWQLAAAVLAALAFAMCTAYVAFDQRPRIYGHRASAARLWVVCEKYRALLAEIQEGAIDLSGLAARRAALLQEAAIIFEQIAPHDRHTFEIARRALKGRGAIPAAPAPPAANAATT